MREINTHKTNPCNLEINVHAEDEKGPGNSNHRYRISYPGNFCVVGFQNGPIAEVGVNGITNEALLAILIDRMEGFQTGPYECHENAMALVNLEAAIDWLKTRTDNRNKRGVEGTSEI